MGEIDEVIKRQIRSEPIQIAGQKRKTCSHSISFTVFFRRIELVSTYFYQWASEYGGSIKQEQEGAHHPTKNISHQPGSVFWVMVASCSSLLTLGHSYGFSQLCWAVLNIKKQRKKISTSLGCMQVFFFFLSLEVNQRHQEAKELTFWKVFISFLVVDTFWMVATDPLDKVFQAEILLLGKASQSTPTSIPLFIVRELRTPEAVYLILKS